MRVLFPVLGLVILTACSGKGNPNNPSPASQLTVTTVHLWENTTNSTDCKSVPLPSTCTLLTEGSDGTYPYREGIRRYTFYLEYITTCGKTVEISYTNTADLSWGGGPINAPGAPPGFASEVACAVGGGPRYAVDIGLFGPDNGRASTNAGNGIKLTFGYEFTVTIKLRELAAGLEPVEWTKDFRMKYVG